MDIANLFRDAANFLEDLNGKQPRFKSDYRGRGLSAYSRIDPNSIQRFGVMLIGKGIHRYPKLRRTIAIGLDRKAILEEMDVKFNVNNRYLDGRFLGFDPQVNGFGLNRAEAKRLIAAVKAENADLKPLRFGAYGKKSKKRTMLVTQQLATLGLPFEIVDIPKAALSNLDKSNLIDVLVAHEVLPTFGDDPLPILLHDQPVEGVDSKLADLRSSAATQLDQKHRAQLYGQIERRLMDLVPYIPIGMQPAEQPGEYLIVGPRVEGAVDPITKRLDPLNISIFSRIGLTKAARQAR